MVKKVSVEKPVQVILGALMLMNVQKWRLQERKRQHQVHQHGNARSHTHIVRQPARQVIFQCLGIRRAYFLSLKPTSAGLRKLWTNHRRPQAKLFASLSPSRGLLLLKVRVREYIKDQISSLPTRIDIAFIVMAWAITSLVI
jgi:hypothetical protein